MCSDAMPPLAYELSFCTLGVPGRALQSPQGGQTTTSLVWWGLFHSAAIPVHEPSMGAPAKSDLPTLAFVCPCYL